MRLASKASSVWECCSKDLPPFLLCGPLTFRICCLMFYSFFGYVVATFCLVLEKALAVHILTAARSPPIDLVLILLRHPFEEVSAHEVVIKVGLITICVIFDELIRQSID